MNRLLLPVFIVLLVFISPLALAESADDWYQKGQAAYTQGKMDEALNDFTEASQADPNNANAFFNIGAIQYNLKHYNNALTAFNQVLQIDPNDQSARYETARVYERLNRVKEAIAAYEMITPESTRYQKAQDNITRLHTVQTSTVKPTTAYTAKPEVPKLVSAQVEDIATGFAGPTGVVIDNGGVLYVANFSKNTISKIDTDGTKQVFASGVGINGPVGMVLDHHTGNLYIANHLDNTVSQITPSGKVIVIAQNLKKPYNMFLDESHHTLYVSQQQNNSVAKIQLAD